MDDAVPMPLTFIVNSPREMNLKLIAESEQKIEELSRRIEQGTVTKKLVPLKSRIVHFIGKVETPAARLFGLELRAGKECTSCGLCWENCPQQNIKQKENGRPGFGFNCIMCMRCIYNCPEQAISPRMSKFIPIKGGYSLLKYIQE